VTTGRCRDYAAWRTAQPVASFEDQVRPPGRRSAFREGKLKYPVPVALPAKAPLRTRWLTRSEAARLLRAAWRGEGRRVARFILVALYTGSRHDAVLKLRWVPSIDAGWVDLDQGVIYRKGRAESQSSKRRPRCRPRHASPPICGAGKPKEGSTSYRGEARR
jgi:integrase